jgi:hypothetical protein
VVLVAVDVVGGHELVDAVPCCRMRQQQLSCQRLLLLLLLLLYMVLMHKQQAYCLLLTQLLCGMCDSCGAACLVTGAALWSGPITFGAVPTGDACSSRTRVVHVLHMKLSCIPGCEGHQAPPALT